MKPRRTRSRKRSAASSTAPLEGIVFYLDESIYSKLLLEAMRAAGATVEHVRGAIPSGTADDLWLTIVGKRQWIALMRDQRVRWRKLERQSLKAAAVAAFVFTGGQATAQDTADVIVPKLAKFAKIARSEKRPFLYALTRAGKLSKLPLD